MKGEELPELILAGSDKGDDFDGILNLLWKNTAYKHTLFHEIPQNIRTDLVRTLIEMIDMIDVKKYDVAGRTSEYFIARNRDNIENFGAYYTHPLLADYLV